MLWCKDLGNKFDTPNVRVFFRSCVDCLGSSTRSGRSPVKDLDCLPGDEKSNDWFLLARSKAGNGTCICIYIYIYILFIYTSYKYHLSLPGSRIC